MADLPDTDEFIEVQAVSKIIADRFTPQAQDALWRAPHAEQKQIASLALEIAEDALVTVADVEAARTQLVLESKGSLWT